MKLKAIIYSAEDGGFWVEVPQLPGCASEGDTLEEARANIREAVEGVLLVYRDRGEEVPLEEGAEPSEPGGEVYELDIDLESLV
jgi:predicted RNase H-like HicB family nuclease